MYSEDKNLRYTPSWTIKVSKGAKIRNRNRYNQVPHLTQDTKRESDKLTVRQKREPRGQHKAHINRRAKA